MEVMYYLYVSVISHDGSIANSRFLRIYQNKAFSLMRSTAEIRGHMPSFYMGRKYELANTIY